LEPFKILFATKFAESAFDSLVALLPLKKAGLEEIILTHIIPRDEVAFVPYGGYMKEEEERLEEEARLRFKDWQKTLSQGEINSAICIKVGNPIAKIVEIAEDEKVKLISVGHKKRTGVEKILIGSHTLEILRLNKAIPTLISKYPPCGESTEEPQDQLKEHFFSRPLLAIDWSDLSDKALHFVADFQGVVDRLDIVHVIDSKGFGKTGLKRLERESTRKLNEHVLALKKRGLESQSHLRAGKTVDELLGLSDELKSTMIILGTTGKDRIADFFLGSVSHRIAEISDRPTLLVS
jgi:nucleotide-binding universal stress UspA family protein